MRNVILCSLAAVVLLAIAPLAFADDCHGSRTFRLQSSTHSQVLVPVQVLNDGCHTNQRTFRLQSNGRNGAFFVPLDDHCFNGQSQVFRASRNGQQFIVLDNGFDQRNEGFFARRQRERDQRAFILETRTRVRRERTGFAARLFGR